MPVCKGCGGSYDDKFKFCPYCGRATPEPESLKVEIKVTSNDRFEICQIENYQKDGNVYSSGKFYAEAIGTNGEYVAGESPIYWIHHQSSPRTALVNGYSGAAVAHSFLVNQLSKDGWEAVTLSGGEWWQTRFQRRIGEDYPKPWSVWIVRCQSRSFSTKGHLALSSIKKEDKNWVDVVYRKSGEYKMKLLMNIEYENSEEKRERQRILEEFIEKIVSDGFEPVEEIINEQLKKCLTEKTDRLWYLWLYRVFLKREQL